MTKADKKLLTTSPCIGICSTSFGDDVCYGCKRTASEVIEWNSLQDDEKDKINRRLLTQTTTTS